MTTNTSLHRAKDSEYDEFYTQLSDIENELQHYESHFRGKVVYCNCDDPTVSNFFVYFRNHFARLGLKRLITTCYKNQNHDWFSRHNTEQAIMLEYDGFWNGDRPPNVDDIGVTHLQEDGDFRSPECVAILKRADIVVTNPPFSLFRPYVAQLMENDKQFLIIGNQNAVTYKEIFPLIKENRIWLGVTPKGQDMLFDVPEEHIPGLIAQRREGSAYVVVDSVVKRRLGNAAWFTNLSHDRRNEELVLSHHYTPEDYPQYDNFDAIEVSRVESIPLDYPGIMGVPIGFLDKHNPDQFEVIWTTDRGGDGMLEDIKIPHVRYDAPVVNGKGKYKRIFIRNRRLEKPDSGERTAEANALSKRASLPLFDEGFPRTIEITRHERSSRNREAAIRKHGVRCFGCQREMAEMYGHIADGYVHIHHAKPLAALEDATTPDIDDLIPLCPNCHAVVHLEEPPVTLDGLRGLIRKAASKEMGQ